MNSVQHRKLSANADLHIKRVLSPSMYKIPTQLNCRISDVTLEVTPKSTFDDKSGGKTSYLDYYKNRWGFKIEDPAQPMLIAISKVSISIRNH